MDEDFADTYLRLGREAAAALVAVCADGGADGCRIPCTLDGADYVVTVTKMEAPVNDA